MADADEQPDMAVTVTVYVPMNMVSEVYHWYSVLDNTVKKLVSVARPEPLTVEELLVIEQPPTSRVKLGKAYEAAASPI